MEETTEENVRQGMAVLATFGRTAGEFMTNVDEVNHRDGLWWYEAPIPPRSHKCSTWTHGWVRLSEVRRCACGAIQHNGSDWMERNARRKDESVEENTRALGAGLAAVGPFMHQRASEFGARLGVEWTKMRAAMGERSERQR